MGKNWRGKKEYNRGAFPSRRSASTIWLCLFGPISQPQRLENDARFARNDQQAWEQRMWPLLLETLEPKQFTSELLVRTLKVPYSKDIHFSDWPYRNNHSSKPCFWAREWLLQCALWFPPLTTNRLKLARSAFRSTLQNPSLPSGFRWRNRSFLACICRWSCMCCGSNCNQSQNQRKCWR